MSCWRDERKEKGKSEMKLIIRMTQYSGLRQVHRSNRMLPLSPAAFLKRRCSEASLDNPQTTRRGGVVHCTE